MVGKLPDATRAGRLGFAAEGDAIALVGPFEPSLVGSELEKLRGRPPVGELPVVKANEVRDAHEAVRHGIRTEALHNAHDVSEGGVAVALAECCIAGGIGASVRLPEGLDPFGEAPGRGFIVSGREDALSAFTVIGRVGGGSLAIEGLLELAVSALRDARESGLDEWV
jgi:phosphoribosylformylglycinamidine synthase